MAEQKILSLDKYLKKYNSIEREKLSKYSLKNIFSVIDKGKNSYFNMCTTLNFENLDKIPIEYYKLYMVKAGDTWTNISYKFYNTIKLWWLLCKFNGVKAPFNELVVGNIIKIPNQEFIVKVLDSLINI